MAKSYYVEWTDAMNRHDFELAKHIATEFHKEKGSDEYLKTYYYDAVFYEKYMSESFQAAIDETKSFYEQNPSIINEMSVSYCAYRLHKYSTAKTETLFRPRWLIEIYKFGKELNTLLDIESWVNSTEWSLTSHKDTILTIINELKRHESEQLRLHKRMKNRWLAIIISVIILTVLTIIRIALL